VHDLQVLARLPVAIFTRDVGAKPNYPLFVRARQQNEHAPV
jgi:hypothetical protein